MQTEMFGKDEAKVLFSETGFDKRYWAAVKGSRALSRMCSRVDLPDQIEIPVDRPMMIAANHSSLFDLVAALILLGNYGINARIGVNSRFFANPAGGAFLQGIGCIPFSKDDKESAEQAMVDALVARQSAAIMPEGRITRPDDQVGGIGQFRPGVCRIAHRAGAAILPVGFAFANEAWKPGTPFPKLRLGRHSVVAHVGAPVFFESDDHITNATHLQSLVSELVLSARATRDA